MLFNLIVTCSSFKAKSNGNLLQVHKKISPSKVYDFTCPEKLNRFPVPDMISFLSSETDIQLHSCYLPSPCQCHLFYIHAYLSMIIIVMVHEYEHLIGAFAWKLAFCLLLPERYTGKKKFSGAIQFRSYWRQPRAALILFGSHFYYPYQPFKCRFLISGTGNLVNLWFVVLVV